MPTPSSTEAGAYAFRSLWDTTPSSERPTAILTVSDAIAVGVLRAARELGVPVPERVSVIGYDDVPLAHWTQPALTTVRQPVVEKGEAAAQLLLELIAGKPPPSSILLPTELIVRASTGPIPADKGVMPREFTA